MSPIRLPAAAAGCLYALLIAVVTAALLLVNGSIVLVMVQAFAQSGFALAARKDLAQVLLLALPVLMVVVQWKLIEYVFRRFQVSD